MVIGEDVPESVTTEVMAYAARRAAVPSSA